jgi:hypothetical protein
LIPRVLPKRRVGFTRGKESHTGWPAVLALGPHFSL